jgi:hypothetical protein
VKSLTNREPDDEIALLEQRIEQLSDSVATCQKISVGSKVAIAAGSGWLGLIMLRVVPFGPTGAFAALTAIIGGVVLLGSNSRTWMELDAERAQREAERAALIDGLPLRLVDERVTLH